MTQETERFNFWCKGCGVVVVWCMDSRKITSTPKQVQNNQRNANRKARADAMRACGLVSYRTDSGAIRWE